MRTWPSRRFQIIAVAVLLIGAALQIFRQPLTPKGRAYKLYVDSWYAGQGILRDLGNSDQYRAAAVKCLEQALVLDPDNSLYQQAIVWKYDKEQLPLLLKTHRLGSAARRLAAARYAEWSVSSAHTSGTSNRELAEKALEAASVLSKADSTNSLPHYRKASALVELDRIDEAYAELRTANRLGPVRLYLPQASVDVMDSMVSPVVPGSQISDPSKIRRLAQSFSEVANDYLRQGDVQGAREMLEECSWMGVNVSASLPESDIYLLNGVAIQSMIQTDMRPLYKDFGTKSDVARLRRLGDAYDRARRICREGIDLQWDVFQRQMTIPCAVPITLVTAAILGCIPPVAFALLWIIPAIIRWRRRQAAVMVSPWSEGFLTRMFVALYVPLFALSIATAYRNPELLFLGEDAASLATTGPIPVFLVAVVNVLIVVLILRVMHHQYDAYTGERTGIFRFIFKAPVNVKAWTRKYLVAAFGAQILFILCCAMLATIIYKPIFGGHPWEENRFRISSISHEQAIAKELVADIVKANLTAPDKAETKRGK